MSKKNELKEQEPELKEQEPEPKKKVIGQEPVFFPNGCISHWVDILGD